MIIQKRNFNKKDFNKIQEWECLIEDFDEKSVYSRVYDLTDMKENDDIVSMECPINNFTKKQKEKIYLGSIFIFSIYQEKENQDNVFSKITFKKIKKWTKKDLEIADRKAKKIVEMIQKNS